MQITIPGKPIAKARPRFFRRGKGVGTYDSQTTEAGKFMLLVREQCGGKKPMDGPVLLTLTFKMPRPKDHYGTGKNAHRLKPSAPEHHTKKPDLDNLVKFVKDCLNRLLWNDDSQVVCTYAAKEYSEEPKTIIQVEAV